MKVIVGGQSYEGRDIKGIEINNGDGLPGVVIESGNYLSKPFLGAVENVLFCFTGIHAREWITTAATSWIINEVLKDTDPIWKQFNWLYFPNVNPDGYAFTWDSVS